jgi:hypothetical protein
MADKMITVTRQCVNEALCGNRVGHDYQVQVPACPEPAYCVQGPLDHAADAGCETMSSPWMSAPEEEG